MITESEFKALAAQGHNRIPLVAQALADLDTPLSLYLKSPFILVINPQIPARNALEFIQYAKERPGKLNYSSQGNTGAPYLSGQLLNARFGLDILNIPYKAASEAMQRMVAGEVQVATFSLGQSVALAKAGKIKALAISSLKRSPLAPDLPTVAESGLPGFEGLTWFGLMVPAGTPLEIQHKLAKALQGALQHSDVQTKLMALGAEPAHGTPQDMHAVMRDDALRWGKVIQDAGVKFE